MSKHQNILVSNIQRFSLHDGPGIRTTIFLKGCTINCPWCCNPENIEAKVQVFNINNSIKTYGKFYSVDELYSEIIKELPYFEQEDKTFSPKISKAKGGVTFSGGEPILQANNILPLLKKLKKKNINIVFETSLFINDASLIEILNYVDLFYVDIKILDEVKCKSVLGGNIQQYYKNIEILKNANVPFVFRIPFISKFTDNEKNVLDIIKFLEDNNTNNLLGIEILKGHYLGKDKYFNIYNKLNSYYASQNNAENNYQTDNLVNLLKSKLDVCVKTLSI